MPVSAADGGASDCPIGIDAASAPRMSADGREVAGRQWVGCDSSSTAKDDGNWAALGHGHSLMIAGDVVDDLAEVRLDGRERLGDMTTVLVTQRCAVKECTPTGSSATPSVTG